MCDDVGTETAKVTSTVICLTESKRDLDCIVVLLRCILLLHSAAFLELPFTIFHFSIYLGLKCEPGTLKLQVC
jgi:hypothetical protein